MEMRGNNTSYFLQHKHHDDAENTIDAMKVVSKIFDLDTIKSDYGKDDNKIKTFIHESDGIKSTLKDMGSGFEQALIIISNLFLNENNTVFLLKSLKSIYIQEHRGNS
jgi:hypothetical protein